jgi:hypothetical protein
MSPVVVLDLKRITAEVAARHGMLLRPDDPAMLLVTMNEVVLQQLKGRPGRPESPCGRRFRRILTLGDCTREN